MLKALAANRNAPAAGPSTAGMAATHSVRRIDELLLSPVVRVGQCAFCVICNNDLILLEGEASNNGNDGLVESAPCGHSDCKVVGWCPRGDTIGNPPVGRRGGSAPVSQGPSGDEIRKMWNELSKLDVNVIHAMLQKHGDFVEYNHSRKPVQVIRCGGVVASIRLDDHQAAALDRLRFASLPGVQISTVRQ